jgi:hypothetical protein
MVWLEIIGWLGSALLVWSLLQTRVLRLRVLNLIGSIVLVVYNAVAHVWPMFALNLVLAGINAYQLRRMVIDRHDAGAYDVVEVEADGDLVAQLLDRHRADIARFNPPAPDVPPTGPRLAFAVLSGDQIAGLMLVRDVGDRVAQVELDYVTPEFRDFTPGEFVFHRSGVFADRGFTQIVTPPGMVGAYYGRLGFRSDGASYVLDLADSTAG